MSGRIRERVPSRRPVTREGGRSGRGAVLLSALLFLLATPEPLLAWGPATHLYVGTELLRSLTLLGPPAAALLSAYPLEFLYGNLAPDIPLAKRYAPVGRHCHHWHVAREVYDEAGQDPRLRSAALGYLCHLAADVVAHGSFVPRMLLLTSSTRGLGHSYWEHRMDSELGSEYARLVRRLVIEMDHSHLDAMLRRSMTRTVFSFRTNHRIFRGMVRLTDHRRWQSLFDTVVENSRWELEEEEIRRYRRHTFEVVADFVLRDRESRAVAGDPIGSRELAEAKQIRRRVILAESWNAGRILRRAADRRFPLPTAELGLWEERGGTPEVAARVQRHLEARDAPRAAV